MNVQKQLPVLCDSARRMLPGLLHARTHLDIAVKVLTYFDVHAQQERSTGVRHATVGTDPALLESAKQMQSLFSAYCRIHQPPK
jgi:hypothetical protein